MPTGFALQAPEWNVTLDIWEAHSSGGHMEVQVWDDDRMRGDDHIASAIVDVGRTLLSTTPAAQQDVPGCTLYPALGPAAATNGRTEPPDMLPTDGVVVRDVLLMMPAAKHRRGVPRVYLRLTWVPIGATAPWGAGREGSPLVPWRPTSLRAMQGLLPAASAISADAPGRCAPRTCPVDVCPTHSHQHCRARPDVPTRSGGP